MTRRTRSNKPKRKSKSKDITFLDALTDPKLLGMYLQDQETWRSWFTLWRAFYALPPKKGDLALYRECTGRQKWPVEQSDEIFIPIGVRGGKSYQIALLAVYLAFFKKHNLSKGETGFVLIVSPTKRQSKIIKDYASGFLNDHPGLKGYIENETQNEIRLTNNTCIATLSSDFRSVRGFTAIAAIVDELAYLLIEGSKPDVEVIRSLRSRLLSTGGPLIAIGSPYARRGEMWKAYKNYHGVDDSPTLVWKAPSRTMNPTLSKRIIERALAEDPAAARADYLAEFRTDIESFIDRDSLEKLIAHGRTEIPPARRIEYRAFVDPAGGSGTDSMTLAICHTEYNGQHILDSVREVPPPFSPDEVVRDFAAVCRLYSVDTVYGDRFGGDWVTERFEKYGIVYELAQKSKSELYRDFLPLLNSGTVQLLDNDRLINQIANLERRTTRGSREIIDHPSGGHDDLANVAAGALTNKEHIVEAGVWGSEYEVGFSMYRNLPQNMEIRKHYIPGDKHTPGGFVTEYDDGPEFSWK